MYYGDRVTNKKFEVTLQRMSKSDPSKIAQTLVVPVEASDEMEARSKMPRDLYNKGYRVSKVQKISNASPGSKEPPHRKPDGVSPKDAMMAFIQRRKTILLIDERASLNNPPYNDVVLKTFVPGRKYDADELSGYVRAGLPSGKILKIKNALPDLNAAKKSVDNYLKLGQNMDNKGFKNASPNKAKNAFYGGARMGNTAYQNGVAKATEYINSRIQNGLVFDAKCYEEGQKARKAKKSMESNPYVGDEDEAKSWLKGWENPYTNYRSLGIM